MLKKVIPMNELSVVVKVNLTMRFKVLTRVLPILARCRLISYEKAIDMLKKSFNKCDIDVIDSKV